MWCKVTVRTLVWSRVVEEEGWLFRSWCVWCLHCDGESLVMLVSYLESNGLRLELFLFVRVLTVLFRLIRTGYGLWYDTMI